MRMFHGWWADRREEARRHERRQGGGHIAVVALSLALGAIGFGLLAVPGSPALIVGTVLAFGLGWAWPGLLQFAVVRLNPSAPAAATSIVQVGVYAGGFAGPIVFGWLAAHASFPVAWSVAAVAMVVTAALMVAGTADAAGARRPPSGSGELNPLETVGALGHSERSPGPRVVRQRGRHRDAGRDPRHGAGQALRQGPGAGRGGSRGPGGHGAGPARAERRGEDHRGPGAHHAAASRTPARPRWRAWTCWPIRPRPAAGSGCPASTPPWTSTSPATRTWR